MDRNNLYSFVTGSSRDIGRAIAEELAREGHIIAVHGSKNSDHLQEAFQSVKRQSPKSICVTGDLAIAENIDHIFDEIKKEFGKLDVMVNNAAMQNPSHILDLKLEDWDRVMAVNLRAAFLCGLVKAGE